MSGPRTLEFQSGVSAAAVKKSPTWRRPFLSRVRSKKISSSAQAAERARIKLVDLGAPNDVAMVMCEIAKRTPNEWVYRDGFRVKISKTSKKRKFGY